MVIGTALQTFGDRLETEQEVLSFAADVLIDTYAAESAVARAAQAAAAAPPAGGAARGGRARLRQRGRRPGWRPRPGARSRPRSEGDTLRTLLAALRRVLKPAPVNTVRAAPSARRGRHGAGRVYSSSLMPLRILSVAATLASRRRARGLAAACTSGPPAPGGHAGVPEGASPRHARVKDKAFREEPEPIPADKRDTLLPLRYYAPDPSYTAPAELKLANQRPVFEMPTSTGKLRRMERVGVLEFSLKGQPMSLGGVRRRRASALENLFVPFADHTTGKETYPAGRYLDIHPTSTGFYTIDFNMAYNPTCAYNETYDCPFPPPSNRLKVRDSRRRKGPRLVTSRPAGDHLRLRRGDCRQRAAALPRVPAGARRGRARAVADGVLRALSRLRRRRHVPGVRRRSRRADGRGARGRSW